MASRKRRRTTPVVVSKSAVRPIDKQLINVAGAALDATQDEVTLFTTTFPATITGLRWSMGFIQDAGTAETACKWAIIVARDQIAASALVLTSGSSMYQPEQNVLAYGSAISDLPTAAGWTGATRFEGSTKTMRKLQTGDKILFIAKGEATNTWAYDGTVQFFVKS